jgi:hypothetical protein
MQADELRDASRERLLAEIGALQHQYDISNQHQLLGRVRELEMALLQSRDYSMGLSAEVGELRAAIACLAKNNQKLRKTIEGFTCISNMEGRKSSHAAQFELLNEF